MRQRGLPTQGTKLGVAANLGCRASRQRGRMGVRRDAHGRECKRTTGCGKTNRRECQLCAELDRVTACNTAGFIVSQHLLSLAHSFLLGDGRLWLPSSVSLSSLALSFPPSCIYSPSRPTFNAVASWENNKSHNTSLLHSSLVPPPTQYLL
jgi:hypothetical protein